MRISVKSGDFKGCFMDIGMPTLIEFSGAKQCAALCEELGFKFIELNMNVPEYQTASIDAGKLSDVAAKHGIYYTIHLDENFNACDFNAGVAKAYANTAFGAIELAKELDIPVINMHLSNGVYFTMPEGRIYLFDRYIEYYLDSLKRFRDECEKSIGGSGIIICIENSDGWGTGFSLRGIELLLESRAFGLTLDTGHNHSSGGGDEKIIMRREDRLCHMHLHDALGEKNHLVLGTGELDLAKYFALAKKRGIRAVIEAKTAEGLRRSAAYINTHVK